MKRCNYEAIPFIFTVIITISTVTQLNKTRICVDAAGNSNNWKMFGRNYQRTSQVYDNDDNDDNDTSPAYNLIPQNPLERCQFQTSHRNEKFYTSPAVVDNTIYIGSFISNLPIMGSFPPYEKSTNRKTFWWWGDGYVYSINATSCELNWEFNTGSWIEGSLAVEDNIVYVGNGDGYFYAINATDGKPIWEYRLPDEKPICNYLGVSFIFYALFCNTRPFFSSPLIFNDAIYFGSKDGHLNILNKTSGSMIRRVKVNAEMHSALALSPDQTRLYGATAEDTNNVYAFNVSNGDILWNSEVSGVIYALSPAVDVNDRLFWITMDGQLAAFDGLTGEKIWEMEKQMSRSSVSIATTNIGDDNETNQTTMMTLISTGYVGGFDGEIIAFDLETGETSWKYELKSFSEGVSIDANGALVVGDYAGHLTKLDEFGNEIWSFCAVDYNCQRDSTHTAIQGVPVIYNGTVIFGSYDGNVYVIEES